MKKIQLLIIALLVLSGHGAAQHYSLYGLEIYNPHFKNPAFTGADKLVQADFLRHSNWNYSGNKAFVMTTLPGKRSSAGINFENNSMYTSYSSLAGPGDEGLKYYNMGASYNHTFILSEELKLHAGGRLNYGKINFLPAAQISDSTLQYDAYYSTMLGVGIDFRNWELGLSANLLLVSYRYSLADDNTLE